MDTVTIATKCHCESTFCDHALHACERGTYGRFWMMDVGSVCDRCHHQMIETDADPEWFTEFENVPADSSLN